MKSLKYDMRLLLLLLMLFCSARPCAAENLLIQLRGHLGPEKMVQAQQTMAKAVGEDVIAIEMDSNSGDLEAVLNFAKALYLFKLEKKAQVIVYIDGKALGPAAIVPFVADQLYISPFVSWGDVPFGNESMVPGNILRSQVVSLIDAARSQKKDLLFLAAAMTDKELPPMSGIEKSILQTFEQVPGQPLVVNQQQLQGTWFIQGIMSLDAFRAKWHLPISSSKNGIAEGDIAEQQQRSENLTHRLEKYIHARKAAPFTIGHLIIEDHSSSISQATWLYVKNGLDYYKKTKPAFIILELNTPGGEVFAAQKISDALKEFDTQYDIPIVCFINNWAISAGAMLAYSCRFIAVTKDGSMGAAEPVIMGEDYQMKTASEKVNSALRADFANRARFFDRNPLIAEAMVDKDMILVLRHGQILKLDNESQIRQTGPSPDKVISPKGKLLTLSAAEMMEYGVADLLLMPAKTSEITQHERDVGKWEASKMLLFTDPYFKQFGAGSIDSYQMDWKSRFFAFLALPYISSLLLLGVILGFYLELSAPGFGLAGSIALISLVLIILSSFALEIANWLEVILLCIGAIIILAEIFVIPTFGLLGVFGIICFLIGLMGLLIPGISSVEYEFDTQTFNAAGDVVLQRVLWICGTLVAAFGIILVLARYLSPYLASYSKLVLRGDEQETSQGYIAGEDPAKMPKIGQVGEVLSTLRPAGKIAIDGHIWDGISQGSFIEKGAHISVIGNEGSNVIVKLITPSGDKS